MNCCNYNLIIKHLSKLQHHEISYKIYTTNINCSIFPKLFFHVWSLLSIYKYFIFAVFVTIYFNLPALTFIRICNAKHDKSNVTYYSGQFYSAIILKTQTCRLLPFMCLFCVCVCALSTIYEMYRLPPLCADINVSSGRFRVRIYVWRSLRPALDSVCACFSALSPDLLRRRNERD